MMLLLGRARQNSWASGKRPGVCNLNRNAQTRMSKWQDGPMTERVCAPNGNKNSPKKR